MFTNASQAVNSVDFAFLTIALVNLFFYVLVGGLLLYFVFRYNRKRNPISAPIEGSLTLEIVWTVIPTLLVLVFFWVGYRAFLDIRVFPSETFDIKVTARMWSWSFEYPNGEVSNVLYAPKGEKVRLKLNSADVLHSLYIPAFRIKQDCVPGLDTQLWFRANNTGTYNLFCTEYCGQLHSKMYTDVVIMEPEEWEKSVYAGGTEEVMVGAEGDDGGDVATKKASLSQPMEELSEEQLISIGKKLTVQNGCNACHSTDGSKLVGPSYKGLYGSEHVVTEDGEEKTITVDEAYIKNSILYPNKQVAKGYQPLMPKQNLDEKEIDAITAYLKSLQ